MSSPRNVIVRAGGVDFTGDTLANVQIDMGARTAWEQNVAGLATVIIQQDDPGILIGEDLIIEVDATDIPTASGGTQSTITVGGVRYRLHVFTTDGTLEVTAPGDVEYLIIGGGGGGGFGRGGGGGAGGLLAGTINLTTSTYNVVVGEGGAGSTTSAAKGQNGESSSFAGLTALGGGGGGSFNSLPGANGASGGGAGATDGSGTTAGGTGTAGQGNDGGDGFRANSASAAGGGGGASTDGGDGSSAGGGNGGAGITSSITGTAVGYAGGGGGGIDARSNPNDGGTATDGGGSAGLRGNAPSPGVDGTGGGGGGGAIWTDVSQRPGADGGDGIVIIRYPDAYQPVFTGQVDTTSAELTSLGPLWTITASGPLTRAGRQNATSVIAADTDGDQIALLAQEALAVEWEEVGGTWAAQTATWDGFAVDTSAIDQPGQYALAAITTVPTNAVEAMTEAAFSGSGWLYETRDGLLGFADSTHRELLPADDYIVIPGSATSRNAFVTVTQESDVANDIIVEYDGGEVAGKANDSIQIYGRFQRTYTTTLADGSAASDFLTRRLNLEGSPRLNIAGTVSIALDQVSDALYDKLLTVERNTGVILEDVPSYLAPEGIYRGFVEGYRWSLGPVESTLDLYVSEYSLSNFGLRWAAAGPTQWNEVGASLSWENATEALA